MRADTLKSRECEALAAWLITTALLAALAPLGPELSAQQHLPLFTSDEVLEVTLVSDFRALRGDRGDRRPARPGRLLLGGPTDTIGQPVELRTRGNSRRQRSVCRFPPIRVQFDPDSTAATPFHGQRRLKLVTHCRDSDDYERNVVEEYLIYRMYNLLTEASFKVRPARITYVDTSGRLDPDSRFGFYIESDGEMAARVGGEPIEEDDETRPRSVNAEDVAMMAVFQFLVGNTDWSVAALHNIVSVVPDAGSPVPVPYDFDFSGFVDAPYATPAENLGTASVRIRIFRGFCDPPGGYPRIYQRLLKVKPAVEELVRARTELDAQAVREMLAYLDEGWEVLEDPDHAKKAIAQQCRVTRSN